MWAHTIKTGKGKKQRPFLRPAKFAVMPREPQEYAQSLYAALRDLDANDDVTRIVVEMPPQTPEWAAVHDRLKRASAKKENI